MSEHEDDELRSAFGALRQQDRRGVPPFDALLTRARAIRHERDLASIIAYDAAPRRSLARPIILAAAAAVVILGVTLATYRLRVRLASPAASVPNVSLSITAWQSPTRVLLRTPGRDLIAPRPLLSSVLGDIRVPPALRKGGGD